MANTQDRDRVQATHKSAPLALHREATRATASIGVRSPQFDAGATIPARHTDYGEGRTPALQWTQAGGARSYALLVEDPDAPGAQPFVHWLAWNIPPDMHALPEDIRTDAASRRPAGMREGRNDHGGVGWFGPRPPAGDPAHHYHFQLLALDTMLDLSDGATRDELLRTLDGHVIAKGELVATSVAPARQ